MLLDEIEQRDGGNTHLFGVPIQQLDPFHVPDIIRPEDKGQQSHTDA